YYLFVLHTSSPYHLHPPFPTRRSSDLTSKEFVPPILFGGGLSRCRAASRTDALGWRIRVPAARDSCDGFRGSCVLRCPRQASPFRRQRFFCSHVFHGRGVEQLFSLHSNVIQKMQMIIAQHQRRDCTKI